MAEQVKRDLHWLATSPALVGERAIEFPLVRELQAIRPSDHDLEQAQQARQVQHLRLGVYFEDLVELHLRRVDGASNVRRSIPIRENKRTLGELDFLFQNAEGQQEHWEVAVKFYLYHAEQDPDSDRCFLGPRTIDRLDRKIYRMRDHQLPLPQTAPAKECLGPVGPIKSKALVRGRLFYPLDMEWRTCRIGTIPAHDHLRGWWAPISSLDGIPNAEHYVIAQKRDWLSCPPASAAHELYDRDSLRLRLTTDRRHPVQVIGMDADHRELHRGFVVPDEWPNPTER
jgi:uncharacterized protein